MIELVFEVRGSRTKKEEKNEEQNRVWKLMEVLPREMKEEGEVCVLARDGSWGLCCNQAECGGIGF